MIKNMKLGNKIFIYLISFILIYNFNLVADDKIISSPLINLEKIKPSFEEVEKLDNNLLENSKIQNKKKNNAR